MTIRRRSLVAALGCLLLAAGGSARALAPVEMSEILVGFEPSASAAARDAVHARLGAVVSERLGEIAVDRVRVALPVAEAVHAYTRQAGDDVVAFAEPNAAGSLAAAPPSPPNDPAWNAPEQWRTRRANVLQAWQVWPGAYYSAASKPRAALKVAVLDGRIDTGHADFRNASGTSGDARAGGQLALADAKNVVPVSRQTGAMDWHGTFIAGLIGASANNARDVAGVAYGAQIVPVVVADGSGVVTAADAAAGILHAISRGARVVNMSFAIASTSATLQRAVERAGSAGAVMVAAAGNNGGTTTVYPAAYARSYPYVIAVSATGPLDTLAPCSNYNSYVTVAAPGTDLLSLKPGGGTMRMACGTSAATALVTGAAVAMVGKISGITPAAIRDRIARGADDVETTGRDTYTGFGRLNVQRAVWVWGGPAAIASRPAAAGASERSVIYGTAWTSAGVVSGEYSIDRPSAPGRGTLMRPSDKAWGGTKERMYGVLDTRNLSEGTHEVYVRAKDRNGRWGPAAVTTLVVDRHAPEISTLRMEPAVVVPGDPGTKLVIGLTDALSRAMSVTIAFVDATDVTRASFRYKLPSALYRSAWRGTVDAPGSRTFNGAALPPGPYLVRVTAVDESGRATVAETQCAVTADPRVTG